MAQLATPPIPWRVYRHFAAITIAITACLAMFADGENREAALGEIDAQREELAARAEAQAASAPLAEIARQAPPGRFGSDGGQFGEPSLRPPVTGSRLPAPAAASGRAPIPGYSDAYLASLSQEEYERLLASLAAAGMLSEQTRDAQAEQLVRRSRSRSGAPSAAE